MGPASGLRGRADQPVVAPRADVEVGARLEVLAGDALGDVGDGALDPIERVGLAAGGDLLVVEDVPVGAVGGLDVPGLAGGDAIEGDLEVVGQLGGALGRAGLVVDELVAAVGMAVDAVDAAADRRLADLEREAPLEPDRPRRARVVALVVAGERRDRTVAVLELVVGEPEAGPPPARLEQPEQAVEPAVVGVSPGGLADLLGVVALENVVDEDAEPLVDRRLLRDREDAGELVLERTGPVEVDVRGRQRQAAGPLRQERLEPGLGPARELLAAPRPVAALVEDELVQRGAVELGELLRGRDPPDQLVQGGDRVPLRLGRRGAGSARPASAARSSGRRPG